MAVNEVRPYPVGIQYSSVSDLKACLHAANVSFGFDSCIMPIAHPLFKRELVSGKCLNNYGPFTRSDIILVSYDWQLVMGQVSPYLDCDSSNEAFRKSSEAALIQELNYAAHLNLPAVLLSIQGPENTNLARLIRTRCNKPSAQQFWICLPLQCPSVAASYYRKNVNMEDVPDPDTWHWWNKFRQIANSEKNIGLALEIGPDLPDENLLNRWLGEPIRCALIPTNIFLTNKRGYPVLSRPHQAFIKSLTLSDCKIYITGACRHENIVNYRRYIEHVAQRTTQLDPVVQYAQGYEDFLQYPLQPLSDNLESQTYEVFEKDPVKYKYYQDAIYRALLDRVPLQDKETNIQIVMIVGAGRGPLVGAALNAAKSSDRKIKVYAVEKNPNAIVTLYAQKEEIWGDDVTVVAGDMRDFNPEDKADILVSELLGSFGDNELSPECLDGVQRVLKDDGISIPCSYTSYLSPLQSMRLYTEVRSYKERYKHPFAHFEMPYVVHQKNRYHISNVQKLFTFHHPNRDEVLDNSRYETLAFNVKNDCVLHGFSGYFSAVLYKDIVLSIEPSSHTPGMFSWFPIYFPIREPVNLRSGDTLVVHFWRCCNSRKVWYEWCVSEPSPLSIHNSEGRSYKIKLH